MKSQLETKRLLDMLKNKNVPLSTGSFSPTTTVTSMRKALGAFETATRFITGEPKAVLAKNGVAASAAEGFTVETYPQMAEVWCWRFPENGREDGTNALMIMNDEILRSIVGLK